MNLQKHPYSNYKTTRYWIFTRHITRLTHHNPNSASNNEDTSSLRNETVTSTSRPTAFLMTSKEIHRFDDIPNLGGRWTKETYRQKE